MVKLINLYKGFNIKSRHKGSIILIGNFDGLHLGHQKLFTLAQNFKKKYSLKVGVLTFEPMPKMYFNKSIKNFRISNQKQKIKLLNKFKVDFVIIKKFDKVFNEICWTLVYFERGSTMGFNYAKKREGEFLKTLIKDNNLG